MNIVCTSKPGDGLLRYSYEHCCHLNYSGIECKLIIICNPKFKPEDYQIEFLHYKSKDGTSIPISIVYKKGMQKTGDNPLLLYGYGGFNISVTPTLSIGACVWMKHFGGVYCVMNVRGGGEYGSTWHDEGKAKTKMNC